MKEKLPTHQSKREDPPNFEEKKEDKTYNSGVHSMEQGNPFFPVSNILRNKRKVREAREAAKKSKKIKP